MARLTKATKPVKKLNAKAGDPVWCAHDLLLYGEMRLLTIATDHFLCRVEPDSRLSSVELFYPGELVTAEELKAA